MRASLISRLVPPRVQIYLKPALLPLPPSSQKVFALVECGFSALTQLFLHTRLWDSLKEDGWDTLIIAVLVIHSTPFTTGPALSRPRSFSQKVRFNKVERKR